MDNEASNSILNDLHTANVAHQLVPPNNHHSNIAERSMKTFLTHFISSLSSCDKNFPMHLWCRTFTQVQINLNLLRNSKTIPHIPTKYHLSGPFDFNKHLWLH